MCNTLDQLEKDVLEKEHEKGELHETIKGLEEVLKEKASADGRLTTMPAHRTESKSLTLVRARSER